MPGIKVILETQYFVQYAHFWTHFSVMTYTRIIFFCICFLWLPFAAAAQQTGFEILTVGPGTVAHGMNDASTATLIHSSAIYTNPANLAFAPFSGFSVDYSPWIAGLTNTHGSINLRKNNRAIAFGVINSRAGDFELRDRPGPSQGNFSVSYLSLSTGYARRIGSFSVGVTGQFLREQLYVNDATGYALNAGVSSRWLDQKLTVSSVVKNLGEMSELNEEDTPLPMEWRTGFSAETYTFSASARQDLPVTVSVVGEFIHPLSDHRSSEQSMPAKTYFIFALDLEVAETLSIYSGYRTDNTERPISFGGRVSLESISFSYALIPFRTGFGNAHSIGISYRF